MHALPLALPRVIAAAVMLAGVVSVAPLAFADAAPDKVACARAYERAQRLRAARHLRAARGELLVCARGECPAVLRQDCTPWLGEVDAAMPSISIAVRTADGRLETDVRVSVDGAVVAERLTPEPIALDPGEHVLVVETASGTRLEQRVTLREGEREKRIELTVGSRESAPPPVGGTPPPAASVAAAGRTPGPPVSSGDTPKPPAQPKSPPPLTVAPAPTAAYVFAGAGAVVTSVGVVFQVAGMLKRSDLYQCAPSCASGDVDTARTMTWVGNVGLVVGVVSLATAALVYVARPKADAVAVAPGPLEVTW
jgi:hypothetical protein